jgi:hypothetical protein
LVPVQVDAICIGIGGLGPHHPGRGGDLLHRLALHPKAGDEGADLGLSGMTLHDGLHGPGHLLFGQILPGDHFVDGFF